MNKHVVEAYERGWMYFSLFMILVFLVFIGYTLSGFSFYVPDAARRIDPTTVRAGGFPQPHVEEVAPGKYQAYIIGQAFTWLPSEMHFKVGDEVTFFVTSPDVQHGFYIHGTNINVQVIPGEVAKVKTTFKRPGEYLVICNEYCGIGHQNMIGRIVVEE